MAPPSTATDSKARFSDRAGDYAAARPGYPEALAVALRDAFGLDESALVVDVGSGTGLSCEPFLRAGFAVVGVEPNGPMRDEGERSLASWPRFRSAAGAAERTGLDEASCDLYVAAQAFHWFDIAAARAEALRILRRPARAALVWNDRVSTGSPFAEGYEALLLEHGVDYAAIRHRHAHEGSVAAFFGHASFRVVSFANPTRLDFATLVRRVASASYVPKPDQDGYAPMVAALRALFEATAENGRVGMDYVTRVFYGELDPAG